MLNSSQLIFPIINSL